MQSATAAPGSSGEAFDVLLTNTGVTAITVSANTSTASPYILAGNSLFGPDLTGPVSGQSLVASDIFALPFSGGP